MALPLRARNAPAITPVTGTILRDLRAEYRRHPNLSVALTCVVSLLLLASWIDINLLVMPILGCYFALQGINTRNGALFIPGGLLGGAGLGLLLTAGPWCPASGDLASSLFLFACAMGWISISVLSRLFTRHPQWWPVIPGGMMALTSITLVL